MNDEHGGPGLDYELWDNDCADESREEESDLGFSPRAPHPHTNPNPAAPIYKDLKGPPPKLWEQIQGQLREEGLIH